MAAKKRLGTPRVIAHLSRDPRLAAIIDRVGPCRLEPRDEGTHFTALARAIVFQQLAGKAAATIWGRVEATLGGEPSPARVLAATDEALRAAGLSRQKLAYLRDLASRAASGELPVERLHELPDDEILRAATAVKGVGAWTVHMFLMFRLGRPDVLPVGDYGIRKAIQKAYRLRQLPTPSRIEEIAERWRPHATVACWYLWRSLE